MRYDLDLAAPSEALRSAPTPVEEPEPGIGWTKWANAKSPQDPAEYQRAVAAYRVAQFNDLATGKVAPASTRLIDCDEHGAFTTQTRRRGGDWSKPSVIDHSRKRPAGAKTSGSPRSRSSRRARTRRVAGHSRSASQSRDGPGEPPGESDSDDEGEPSAATGLCAGCGLELLEPAPLCGLCLLERGEMARSTRACAVCGADISDRYANAETCSPRCRKQLQRHRDKARERASWDSTRPVRLYRNGGEEFRRRLTAQEAAALRGKIADLRRCDEHSGPIVHFAVDGCPMCFQMLEGLLYGSDVEPLRRAA